MIQPSSLHTLQDCDSAYDGDTDLPQVKRSKIKRKSAVRGKIRKKVPTPARKVSGRLATKAQISSNLSDGHNEHEASDSSVKNSEKRDFTQTELGNVSQGSALLSQQSDSSDISTQEERSPYTEQTTEQTTSSPTDSTSSQDEPSGNNRSIRNVD